MLGVQVHRWVAGAVLLALIVAGVVVGRRAAAASAAQSAEASVAVMLAALVGGGGDDLPLPPGGSPATETQSRELLEAASALEEALGRRDYTAAWGMIHPETRGEASQESWTARQEEVGAVYPSGGDQYARESLLTRADGFTVVGTVLQGDHGWAYVSLDLRASGIVVFRRSDGRWSVDLHGTQEASVAEQVRRQLVDLRNGSGEYEPGPRLEGAPSYLEVGNLPLAQATHHLVSASVDGDRAAGALVTEGRLLVALSLERYSGGYDGGSEAREWEVSDVQTVLVLPPGTDTRRPPPGALERYDEEVCAGNLEQLWMAVRSYAFDYDEHFPLATNWSEAILPYLRSESLLSCPADGEAGSYAYNIILSGRPCSSVERPCQTVVFFETEPSRPSAHGSRLQPDATLADPPRHHGGNHYVFADGGVQWLEPGAVTAAHYRLRGDRPPLPEGDSAVPRSIGKAMMMKMKMLEKTYEGEPMKGPMPFQKASASPMEQKMTGEM